MIVYDWRVYLFFKSSKITFSNFFTNSLTSFLFLSAWKWFDKHRLSLWQTRQDSFPNSIFVSRWISIREFLNRTSIIIDVGWLFKRFIVRVKKDILHSLVVPHESSRQLCQREKSHDHKRQTFFTVILATISWMHTQTHLQSHLTFLLCSHRLFSKPHFRGFQDVVSWIWLVQSA